MSGKPGDFLYIPASVLDLPYNASATEPCVGLTARTDPNDQESVTILDLPDPGIAARSFSITESSETRF